MVSSSGSLQFPPELEQRIEHFGLEFLAEFLGRASARQPENIELLAELATLLTRLGRHAEGLAVDERLVELAPLDPTVRYNLACSLALLGREEAALDALERAHALGYQDAEHMLEDHDLDRLRPHPRFQELVKRLRAAD